ncbi:hypothetical protein BJ996_007175 [Streptomyces phaeogriseichromatogenes]|nr:hypothetical protein [Streptomyces murinus]
MRAGLANGHRASQLSIHAGLFPPCGVLLVQTLLVEWPDGQDTPADYWISNLLATTPVADLVRWAKMRWRIQHGRRELKHALSLDH